MKYKCHFCKKTFAGCSPYYAVKKAIKPPGSPDRWATVGRACESCGDSNNTQFDRYDKRTRVLKK